MKTLSLIGNNFLKVWKPIIVLIPFVTFLAWLSVLEYSSDIQLSVFLFMLISSIVVSLIAPICLYLDCSRTKSIYSIRLSKISKSGLYFSYLAVSLLVMLLIYSIMLMLSIIDLFNLDRAFSTNDLTKFFLHCSLFPTTPINIMMLLTYIVLIPMAMFSTLSLILHNKIHATITLILQLILFIALFASMIFFSLLVSSILFAIALVSNILLACRSSKLLLKGDIVK